MVDKAEGGAVMTNVHDLAIYVSEQTYIYSKNNGSDQNIFDGYIQYGSGSDRHERRASSEGFVKLVGRQSSQYTYARDEHLRFQRIHVLTFLVVMSLETNSDWPRPFACVDCVERARQSWVRWLIRPRGG